LPPEAGARTGTESDKENAIPRAKSAPRPAAAAPRSLLEVIEKTLDDGLAEDVVIIDLQGKTSIADYMVIASGRSARQVVALAERLREAIDVGRKRPAVEGLPQGDWVLVDAGDVIVQLFRPEVRAYYNLEKMWGVSLPDTVAAAGSDTLSA
jgi:ribosome-associated protein